MSDWVAGVDGCRGGWLVVLRPLAHPSELRCRLVKTFGEVLALPEGPRVIAVDIPIGLPETASVGGRAADIAARSVLGERQSAVFAVPSRAAVMQSDYGAACEVALATSDPPRKVSKQTFYLFPKIREVDTHMTPALQDRVMEVHPEVAFWVLNGCRPLGEPKKVKSRPYEPGLALRLGLLRAAGYPTAVLQSAVFRSADAGPDDVLDAAANSAAAARIARGEGRRSPDDPPLDGKGLRLEIWG
jgi:predicted RNase H-like nuclease